jgi:hypothetical protein
MVFKRCAQYSRGTAREVHFAAADLDRLPVQQEVVVADREAVRGGRVKGARKRQQGRALQQAAALETDGHVGIRKKTGTAGRGCGRSCRCLP